MIPSSYLVSSHFPSFQDSFHRRFTQRCPDLEPEENISPRAEKQLVSDVKGLLLIPARPKTKKRYLWHRQNSGPRCRRPRAGREATGPTLLIIKRGVSVLHLVQYTARWLVDGVVSAGNEMSSYSQLNQMS